jgi:hypothetical protein
VLDVDAPVIGALIEGMVIAGVKDGYATLAELIRGEIARPTLLARNDLARAE